MQHTYKTKGTCSQKINFNIEDGIITSLDFVGGCDGNLKGLSSIIEGMTTQEVIKRLEGITCGFRKTSCPDQLARALKSIKEEEAS